MKTAIISLSTGYMVLPVLGNCLSKPAEGYHAVLTREVAVQLLRHVDVMIHNNAPQQALFSARPDTEHYAAVVCSHQDLQQPSHRLMPRLSCRLQAWLPLTPLC